MTPEVADLKNTPRVKRDGEVMRPDWTWPSDPEAERCVLGCIAWNPRLIDVVEGRLGGNLEAFRDLRHQEVFKAMRRAYEMPRVEDVMFIIQTAEQLAAIDGFSEWTHGERRVFVHQMAHDVVGFADELEHYLSRLVAAWTRCRVLTTCYEIASKVNEDTEIAELLDEFERKVMAVRPKSTKERTSIKEVVKQCINQIEEFHQNQGRIPGISTGFIDWDKLTGGLKPGEMTVLAAFPGIGKTALALNVAEHVAIDQKLPVGIFSLEMSAESLVMRMLCSRARVNLRNVVDGFLAERDFPKLTGAASKIANSLIHLHDISDLSVEEYRAESRRMVKEHGVKLIVVDYLQLLTASGSRRKVETRQDEVAAVSSGIKKSALELGVPIIALSQLNDDGKLRESRAIGQDADNVEYLQKDEDGEESAEAQAMTLEIRKQRNGPAPAMVGLTFLKGYTRFESAAKISDRDLPYKQPYKD
jgi:replicative DNA helicase